MRFNTIYLWYIFVFFPVKCLLIACSYFSLKNQRLVLEVASSREHGFDISHVHMHRDLHEDALDLTLSHMHTHAGTDLYEWGPGFDILQTCVQHRYLHKRGSELDFSLSLTLIHIHTLAWTRLLGLIWHTHMCHAKKSKNRGFFFLCDKRLSFWNFFRLLLSDLCLIWLTHLKVFPLS